jgi:hypothetical protein
MPRRFSAWNFCTHVGFFAFLAWSTKVLLCGWAQSAQDIARNVLFHMALLVWVHGLALLTGVGPDDEWLLQGVS